MRSTLGYAENKRRHGDTLVVAGLSARLMADSARRGGWRVIALDVFGDADTRRACGPTHWHAVGAPDALRIDGDRLCAALATAAAEPGVVGWVAGSGFEGDTALLARGAAVLPLLGMPADAVAALRDPRHFFGVLDRLRLPHPDVRFDPPADAEGWLAKRGGGTGGWQVRDRLPAAPWPADGYAQRRQRGVAMSALFLADGRQACIVGLNRLRVQRRRGLPFVHAGVIGPVAAPVGLRRQVAAALAALVPAFSLRGLASLDFIADGDTPWLLEINPRPPASMAVQDAFWPGGLLTAHVHACAGHLPQAPGPGVPAATPQRVGGSQIVWAPRRLHVSAALSDRLRALAGVHDIPMPDTVLQRGAPLCSVSVQADSPAATAAALAAQMATVQALVTIATTDPTPYKSEETPA